MSACEYKQLAVSFLTDCTNAYVVWLILDFQNVSNGWVEVIDRYASNEEHTNKMYFRKNCFSLKACPVRDCFGTVFS